MPSTYTPLSLTPPALALLISVLLWSVPRFDASQPRLNAFAGAYALYGIALIMQVLPWPAHVGWNIMLSGLAYAAAAVVFCQGLGQMGKAPSLWRPCVAIAAVALLLRAWFTFGEPNNYLRIWVLHGSSLLCLALCTWKIRRMHRGIWQERVLFWLLAAFVLSFVPRMLLTLDRHDPKSYGYDSTAFWVAVQLSFHVFMVLFSIVMLLVWTGSTMRRLRQASNIDMLTSLPNRRGFQSTVSEHLERCTRYSLIALDLDRFKKINDRFGHAAGDQVLVQVGQLLRSQLRPGCIPARLGGEEFMVFLPDTPLAAATDVAERLRRTIAARPFTRTEPVLHCTCSFGVAEFLADVPMQEAYRQVDALLYQAKAEGRDRVCTASSAPLLNRPVGV